ncbi:hypothetical protein JCM18899A_25270 [Nocardioides sp. AN3]
MTARIVTIGIFAACLLTLIALGLAARMRPDLVTTPRLLFARLMARRATRVAVTLAWAWLGWHFLVTPPK